MRKMRVTVWLSIAVALTACLAGCAGTEQKAEEESMQHSYTQITQEEAKEHAARQDDGILDWTGEIVTGQESRDAELSYSSFDGGGPEFSVVIEDESILTYDSVRQYYDPNHEQMTGSGYEVRFTFHGRRQGTTKVTISARSPIADNYDDGYLATVDGDLRVTLEPLSQPEEQGMPILAIDAGGETFYAAFEDNPSAQALIEKLTEGDLTLELHDYGSFEKVGDLPWTLPRSDMSITTVPGDVILYLGKQITIYYDQNTWNFTRLAAIDGTSKEDLLSAFGAGNVTVTFRLEWE